MSFVERMRPPAFLNLTGGAIGADFDEITRRLIAQYSTIEPVLADRGAMLVVQSPVLIVRRNKLRQPETELPAALLDRFWTGAGRASWAEAASVTLIVSIATHLAGSDDLARDALEDTDRLYVSDAMPAVAWPDQDRRLRLVSLVLADLARKQAAGFDLGEILVTLGIERVLDRDRGYLETRIAAMKDHEARFVASARAGIAASRRDG